MSGHGTILEMARRHVCEGKIRLARQEEIAAELDRGSYPEAAALGWAVPGDHALIA